MRLTSKKILPFTLVLAGSVVLAACSSKPSPWTESSSPWDNQQQNAEAEPVAIEEAPQEASAVEETIEPAIYPAEQEPVAAEAEAQVEEGYMLTPDLGPEVVEEEQTAAAPVTGSLADQPANYFAVQVVASSSMDQLQEFANHHQLSDEWVAETTVDGKTWYVLMAGVYETKAEAEQAMMNLQDLDTQPWIRTVGSVQAVMNQ